MKSNRSLHLALIGIALLANLFIYLGGARGPFMADDFPNLANNQTLLIHDLSWQSVRDAALSSPASPYGRPLAMLSFALSFSLAGEVVPFPAKVMNILLHLLTGVGVLLLSLRLLPCLRVWRNTPMDPDDCRAVAGLVTALWLFHPLFVSTVLYAVQGMTVMSALFMFWGAWAYVRLRERLAGEFGDYLRIAAAVTLFTTAAFLCKENGLLLPGLLLLIDWFCFGLRLPAGAPRIGRGLWLCVLAVPSVFVVLYLLRYGVLHWDDTPSAYFFTVWERCLTQFRVLTHYAAWLALVNPEPMSLYHDDIRVSGGLLSPATTLPCLLLWLCVFAWAIWQARMRQALAFCVLWFLWGQVMESTVIPLSPVFEHRNYLPGYGLLLAFTLLAYGAAVRFIRLAQLRWFALLFVLLVVPAGLLIGRVQAWGDEREFVIHSLTSQPDSALTLLSVAYFLDSHSDYPGALTALHTAQELDAADAGFKLAEAALLCENRPDARFDPILAGKLSSLQPAQIRTTTAREQFVELVKVCARTTVNDAALFPFYERLRSHRNAAVAVYALYGMAAVRAHRGDEAGALKLWNEAAGRD